MKTLLSLLLLGSLATAALGSSFYGGIGVYGGIGIYGGAISGSIGNGNTTTGYLRFVGPLSAGCMAVVNGNYPKNVTSSVSGYMSTVTVNGSSTVDILSNYSSSCTDLFTGLPVPFFLFADSSSLNSSTFILTPVTKLSEWSDKVQSASNAYAKVGQTQLGALGSTFDAIQLIRAGELTTGFDVLITDIQIATTMLLAGKYLYAGPGYNTTTCQSLDDFVDAVAYMLNAYTSASPFDATNSTAVAAVISGAGSLCGVAASVAANKTAVSAVAGTIAQLSQLAADAPDSSYSFSALTLTVYLTKLMGVVQSTIAPAITGTVTNSSITVYLNAVDTYIQAFPANYNNILAALSLTSPANFSDITITASAMGPISSASLQYISMLNLTESTVTTAANGTVTIPSATVSLYELKGGNDTVTYNAPIIPLYAALPFTPSSGKASITPTSSLVFVKWATQQLLAPSLPSTADWKTVYEAVMGQTSSYDYLIQNWPAGSAVQLATMCVDQLMMSVPSLGYTFIKLLIPSAGTDDLATGLFSQLANDYNRTSFTNSAKVKNIIWAQYNSSLVSSSNRRRLLAVSATDLSSILNSIATIVANANTQTSSIADQAVAAIASGSTIDTSLFKTLAQVSKLQSGDMAAAITNIATLAAAGNIAAAEAAASNATVQYSGQNLLNAIASQTVDTTVLKSIVAPDSTTDPFDTSSSSNKKKVAIGVGVGVGVGGAVLIALVIATVIVIKKRRGSQSTVPAPVAEGVVYAATASTEVASQEAAISAYYQRRLVSAQVSAV